MNSRILKRAGQGILIGVGVVFIILIAFIASAVDDAGNIDIELVVHDLRSLPDFTEGEPAANREAYNEKIATYDQQLSKLTEKSYKLAYIDTCERSQYNRKVKSDYLSSCEKLIQKIYLSKTQPCALLPSVQDIVGANEDDISSRCPNAAYVYKYEGIGVDATTIEISNKRTAVLNTISWLFSGDTCSHKTYCDFDPGNSLDWQQMVHAEDYPTILILESSLTYYKK